MIELQHIENVLAAYDHCMKYMKVTGCLGTGDKKELEYNTVLFDQLLDVVFENLPRKAGVKSTDEEVAECNRIILLGEDRYDLINKIPPHVLEECLPILVAKNIFISHRMIDHKRSENYKEFFNRYYTMVLPQQSSECLGDKA